MTSEARSFIDSFIWTAKQDTLFVSCTMERQALIREIEQIASEAVQYTGDNWAEKKQELQQRSNSVRAQIDKVTNGMLLAAGFSTFKALKHYMEFSHAKLDEYAQALEWAAVDAWNNRDHQTKPLPLMITEQSKVSDHNGENYIASIRRPDGSVVRVLIPVECVDCHANDVVKDSDTEKEPLGLNLISDGHYE